MEKRFERTTGRKAPKHPATAAVLYRQSPWDRQSRWDSQQLAYGVLTNVSVTGACIVIDSWLAPGSDVDLKLSFYQQPCLHEIAARVVWSQRASFVFLLRKGQPDTRPDLANCVWSFLFIIPAWNQAREFAINIYV